MTATQAPTPGPLSGDDDLLPCPFCEGDVIVTDSQECQDAETYYWHRCAGCGVESEGAHGASAARDQWNMRPQPFRLAPTAPVEASGSEEIDLYDDKVQEGISWTMRQWGEALGLTTWTQGDGSESVEGDVGAEIHTILVDAGLRDAETNEMAALRPQPSGETREQCAACSRGEVTHFSTDDGFWVEITTSAGGANEHGLNGWFETLEHYLDGSTKRREYVATDSPALSATPARAEAQDEGAAGEASAYRVRMISNDPAEWVLMHPEKALDFLSRKGWESQPLYAHPSPTPAADADRVLREAGWSVAVHNDYRLNGEAHTFWLWTHPDGRWIKGEGRTDEDALSQCAALIRPAPVASGGQHSSATDFPPEDVLACVPVADAVALSASDRACYEYPGIDQTKERAAFVAGAMASAPAAETAGEAVAWQWRHGDDMEWHTSGVRHAWFDDEALNPRFRLRPLYAAPVPAQDDDRVRIAVEALEKARDRINVTRGPMGSFYRTESSAEALYEAKVAVGIGLSALKSTAAKEGGEG